MEDSMLDPPDLVFDEKVSNKRVRDGEEEINIGRLEKRPSGIFGVNGGGDFDEDPVNEELEASGGGGIIDTFISNVFHQKESVIEGGEVEVGGLMKSDVTDVTVEEKSEDLCIGSGGGHGGDDGGDGESGGGIINTFISNMFHHNGSGDDGGDQAKSDLLNEDGGGGGGPGGSVERADLVAEKPPEKTDTVPDLSSKHLTGIYAYNHSFLTIDLAFIRYIYSTI